VATHESDRTPTHAAFLRAVNLGATRKAPSAKLVEIFEGIGLEDVATFRTSGNVVFAGSGSAEQLTGQIQRALAKGLGFEVPVFLRTAKQLKAIAKQKPFPPKAVEASKGKLQVALLLRKPAATGVREIEALATDDDLLSVKGTELYWLPSGGTQKSPLDMKAIDTALGLNTLRTKGKIQQLYAKFF
jgi:uncharacterized protein (DUF1697 family)